MTDTFTDALLVRAAQRFSRQPRFLGYWLLRHRAERGLSEAEQAAHLGCSPHLIWHMSLCFAPRQERVWEDVTCVTTLFGLPETSATVLHLMLIAVGCIDADGSLPEGDPR